LEALTYDFDNVCNINGLFYRRLGVPGKSNVVWMMKNIVGSEFMTVATDDESVTIGFNSDASLTTAECVGLGNGDYPLDKWNPNLVIEPCKE
jgi:hypothetical protein